MNMTVATTGIVVNVAIIAQLVLDGARTMSSASRRGIGRIRVR